MRKILDANGDQIGGSVPWVGILYKFGIPGFLCLVFAYLLFIRVSDAIANVGADVKASRMEHAQQSQYLREQTRYLYGICVILAKDQTQRLLCIPPPSTDK